MKSLNLSKKLKKINDFLVTQHSEGDIEEKIIENALEIKGILKTDKFIVIVNQENRNNLSNFPKNIKCLQIQKLH